MKVADPSSGPASFLGRLWLRASAAVGHAFRPEETTMVFRQSLVWSRAILWTIIGCAIAAVLWACLAQMDEVVHATGKLEPAGAVQDVQAPVAGIIAEILVREGQTVTAGQPLVRIDPEVAEAELRSLREMLEAVRREESVYESLASATGPDVPLASLPPDVAGLAKNLLSLRDENRLLRARIGFSSEGVTLSADQQRLFEESEKDRKEKLLQAELRAERAEKDLTAAEDQLESARALVANSRKILESFSKLVDSGGVARVDFLARQSDTIQAETQLKRLESLSLSLSVEMRRAREEAQNINTAYRREAMSALSENMKSIAEIESGLAKARLANSQRISEIEARLAESAAALEHHEINSPADGVVFEIVSSKPGTVLAPKDVLLKIVPSEQLIAKVDITNQDIGFVHVGMPVEVEVATFPSREYGKIDGTLTFVGSDALPPTQTKPFYAFPAKVELSRQALKVRGREIALQSGMAVSANIKVRQRRVINLFLDFLMGPVERMEEIR